MKVLLFNGSPRVDGNTFTSLEVMKTEIEQSGIEAEIIQIGKLNLDGCAGCGGCFKTKNMKCVKDDELNDLIKQVVEADGFVFGSPVHYAGISPQLKAFMDRLFYVSGANGNIF